MKIIFMGTPDFAVPSLKALISSKHEVVAIFTAPPKPKGRGMKLTKSPVHELADSSSIITYTPSTLRSPEVLQQIDDIEADIIIVVAYGFIVPKRVLASKKYGCLNVHPSKLPRFRGAAPLQRTIIEGDKETAVCIMQMDEGLDTGDIILREDFPIAEDITLQELHDICAIKGAELLLQTLEGIETLPRISQSEDGLVYASKLKKEEGLVDWSEPALTIERKIRGMSPWPGVFFEHDNTTTKILKAKVVREGGDFKGFVMKCGEDSLEIELLQKPGKAAITGAEFIREIK